MRNNNLIKRLIVYSLVLILGLTFSFTLTKADVSALSKPGKVTLTSVTKDKEIPDVAVLKWKKISKNVTGYKIYRSIKKSSGFKCIGTVKGKSNTTFMDESWSLCWNGKTFYYKVRAYNKKGNKTKYGKYSKVKSFKMPKLNVTFKLDKDSDEDTIYIDVKNNTGKEIYLSKDINVYDYYDYYYSTDDEIDYGEYSVSGYEDEDGEWYDIEDTDDDELITLDPYSSALFYADYEDYDYDDSDYYDDYDSDYDSDYYDDYDDEDDDYYDDEDEDYGDYGYLTFDYSYCAVEWEFSYEYSDDYTEFYMVWDKSHKSRIYCLGNDEEDDDDYDDYDSYGMKAGVKESESEDIKTENPTEVTNPTESESTEADKETIASDSKHVDAREDENKTEE